MKKRKELDALIGSRGKRDNQSSVNGQVDYDSLNSSLSSPDAYMPPSGNYYSASKRVTRRQGKDCGCTLRKMIRICLPVCFLSLVAACITACIGIVWMQVQLKTDVEKLKDRILKLETWQVDQPSELNDMKTKMAAAEKDIMDGKAGIRVLENKLAALSDKLEEKIDVPAQKLDQLGSQNDAIKKDLENLKLSAKTLTSKGENMEAAQGLLNAAFSELKGNVESIRTEISDANVKQLQDISSSKKNIEGGVAKMNETLQQVVLNLTAFRAKCTKMEQHTAEEIGQVNHAIDVLKNAQSQQDRSLSNFSEEVASVKSQIMRIITTVKRRPATTEKPDVSKGQKSVPKSAKDTPVSKRQQAAKMTQITQKPVTLSDVAADVLMQFKTLDTNSDGVLSESELIAKYGASVATALMQQDSDRDGAVSKNELSSILPPSKGNG